MVQNQYCQLHLSSAPQMYCTHTHTHSLSYQLTSNVGGCSASSTLFPLGLVAGIASPITNIIAMPAAINVQVAIKCTLVRFCIL